MRCPVEGASGVPDRPIRSEVRGSTVSPTHDLSAGFLSWAAIRVVAATPAATVSAWRRVIFSFIVRPPVGSPKRSRFEVLVVERGDGGGDVLRGFRQRRLLPQVAAEFQLDRVDA